MFNMLGIAMEKVLSGSSNNFKWVAEKTKKKNIYLVSLVDKKTGRGYFWETNLKTKEVRYINNNKYLCLKYGLSFKDTSGKFIVTKVIDNSLVIPKTLNTEAKGVYTISGYVKNNTKSVITKAGLKCVLNIVFKQKTIKKSSYGGASAFGEMLFSYGFKDEISTKHPWKPGELKKFECMVFVDPVYVKTYKPEFLITDLILRASNPIGFNYNGVIEELPVRVIKEQ